MKKQQSLKKAYRVAFGELTEIEILNESPASYTALVGERKVKMRVWKNRKYSTWPGISQEYQSERVYSCHKKAVLFAEHQLNSQKQALNKMLKALDDKIEKLK